MTTYEMAQAEALNQALDLVLPTPAMEVASERDAYPKPTTAEEAKAAIGVTDRLQWCCLCHQMRLWWDGGEWSHIGECVAMDPLGGLSALEMPDDGDPVGRAAMRGPGQRGYWDQERDW